MSIKNFLFQLFQIPGNTFYGIFLWNKIRKLIQGDLQNNFNSFSEMDSGACKETMQSLLQYKREG